MMKFPTPRGIATLVTRTVVIAECQRLEKKQMVEKGTSQKTLQEEEGPERVDLTEQTLVNPAYPDQLVTIGGNLSEECKSQLRILLKKSMDVFAWEPADMTGVPKRIIEHSLNVNPSIEPAAQKRRVLAADRTQADGSWRMCIDFKNLNSACPKDYYPLPDIDGKIESVVGFRYKCFLDAYKGYHQVQMAQEDEEKTTFYTDRDTRNLEAYVDDMVIKSNDEKMLIADIAETFDNLRKINMKLNPKKCSFGVEEGKFLGYMVTSEGIRANPKKTKAIADIKTMQSLDL
ncbi:reverse transcriptase domain-containing protein [Tanacetum coccineum]